MREASALVILSLFWLSFATADEPTREELLRAVQNKLKTVNEQAGKSVACIVVSRSDRYPPLSQNGASPGKLGEYDKAAFLRDNPNEKRLAFTLDLSDQRNIIEHNFACGVVLDKAGLILTPYHVVEGATKVYVHLAGGGGSYADIHAADSRHDLAVLKLIQPPVDLTPVKFGEVRYQTLNGPKPTIFNGKLAILVSNPVVTGYPIDKPSAALGSITHIRSPRKSLEERPSSYYHYGPVIEHDAKLNSAVDGSALLNMDGELIGLSTSAAAIAGKDGRLFAFPADEAFRRVVDVLRRGEEVEYGFLGVSVPRDPGGVNELQLTSVTPGGPAALAGIQGSVQPDHADCITHVNDVPIKTYEELLLHVGHALAGNKVKLTVSRGGRSRTVEVTLGKFSHKQPYIASVRPEPVFGLRVEYSSILAQNLPVDSRPLAEGVSIREIVPDSPAAAAFKKLGERPERWLITHINGKAVVTPADFYAAAKGQQTIKLTLHDPSEPRPRDRDLTLP